MRQEILLFFQIVYLSLTFSTKEKDKTRAKSWRKSF